MISKIFTAKERQLLESHLTSVTVDQTAVDKLLEKIKADKSLFDDVFLYLQAKKTLSS